MQTNKILKLMFMFLLFIALSLFVSCRTELQNPEPTIMATQSVRSPEATDKQTADATLDSLMPTPTASSGTSAKPVEMLDEIKPVFSQQGGIYSSSFSLSITISDEDKAVLKACGITDYQIHVSYNQEEPTYASRKYSSDITIPHNHSLTDAAAGLTVSMVRAAVVDKKGNTIGKIETATYIKSLRQEDISLPVISLVTAQKNLTGATGIIDNFKEHGSIWERPVHFEFLETNGTLAVSQDAGIRIFGGSSRSQDQKSFRISARKSSYFNTTHYDGDGKFKYAFFPDRLKEDGSLLEVYDSIVLRNGGNDSILNKSQNLRTSLLRDGLSAIITEKASENVDSMAFRPAIVILNGEYYGILNLREHETENYVANVYDIEEKDNITIISSELDTSEGSRYDGSWFYYKIDEGLPGELERYERIMKEIGEGKYTFDQAAQYVDMDNFLEYCAINIFLCNTDWPHNNVRLWRNPDGKYKFMIRDADLGIARYTLATKETAPSELYTKADAYNFRYMMWSEFTQEQKAALAYSGYPSVDFGYYPDPLYLKGVLNFCLKNDGFRKDFVTYCKKLATEIWTADNLKQLLSEQKEKIVIEMKYHFAKWSGKITDTNYNYWFKNTVDESIVQWMNQRAGENGYFMNEIH